MFHSSVGQQRLRFFVAGDVGKQAEIRGGGSTGRNSRHNCSRSTWSNSSSGNLPSEETTIRLLFFGAGGQLVAVGILLSLHVGVRHSPVPSSSSSASGDVDRSLRRCSTDGRVGSVGSSANFAGDDGSCPSSGVSAIKSEEEARSGGWRRVG